MQGKPGVNETVKMTMNTTTTTTTIIIILFAHLRS